MEAISADTLIESETARVEREKADKPDLPGIAETEVGGVPGKRLKTYIERIERVAEEISGLQGDQKDIYAEAKAFGYDVKTLRQIVRLRKIDEQKRREADELLEMYKAAIGME